MIHQRPLAYLLGLEGVALLRAYAGEHDAEFTAARIAEIRRLLDDPKLDVEPVAAGRTDTVSGYEVWSRTYDVPGNGIFAYEERAFREILDPLPPGAALDAACGTGRLSERLAGLGHDVIGVDSSPDMLARARARLPEADFRSGELTALPVDDASVDLVTCALALTHVADLGPVFAEFARVLRPGGHLVVSDVHHELVALGSAPHVRLAGEAPAFLPAFRHRAGDYLGAALPQGLGVRRCVEPRMAVPEPIEAATDPGPWDDWPWSLHPIAPAAHQAAFDGTPALVVWHFQKEKT
ncbi:methyltransferase domain-containing protein [Asanoa sp. WMMD1127]|uniref:class I SAM-dependent methyltransferase n=1 Tax=Asanoa sp. WMMD1127 TaxID=3016107 RepID=UPI0024161627|nr:methyltransferase domain-containing protein [Asanoa sp. WMMD1127]MDG4826728.1 methyltransferase domain-containing protein [Asanoa sp. WMMD1127]